MKVLQIWKSIRFSTFLFFVALILIFEIFITSTKYSQLEQNETEVEAPGFFNKYFTDDTSRKSTRNFLKIFHLDLKGGPPKVDYLLSLLPVIKESGANAILIEYEDMFPFWGKLKNVSAKNAYSPKEIRQLISAVESLEMEVIPLVQTFGHLEYVLKLEEFVHLRELNSFPLQICPSNREALFLLKELIDQVMSFHKNSKHIHIGCDEVRHLGACHLCSRTPIKKLFYKHVSKIASYVKIHYPNLVILMWDDMLRKWTFTDLQYSGLGSLIEPVVWVYATNIYTVVPPLVWEIYERIFHNLWIASAFKGAFGPSEILPDMKFYLENNLAWVNFIRRRSKGIASETRGALSGVILTGWSRYDHFAVLCELLPAGIPSLVFNLIQFNNILGNDNYYGLFKLMEILRCPKFHLNLNEKNLVQNNFFQNEFGKCAFPGSDLYGMIRNVVDLKERIKRVTSKLESSGWVSEYNKRKNFTNPLIVQEMFPEEGFAARILRKKVTIHKKFLIQIMKKYFDEFTVSEWQEQYIQPMENKLKKVEEDFKKLIVRKIWPRRPIL